MERVLRLTLMEILMTVTLKMDFDIVIGEFTFMPNMALKKETRINMMELG